jgi:hypothetical protein
MLQFPIYSEQIGYAESPQHFQLRLEIILSNTQRQTEINLYNAYNLSSNMLSFIIIQQTLNVTHGTPIFGQFILVLTVTINNHTVHL